MTAEGDELVGKLRQIVRELDERRARTGILEFLVAALLIDRFGGPSGFLVICALSFVIGIASGVWADTVAWLRERRTP